MNRKTKRHAVICLPLLAILLLCAFAPNAPEPPLDAEAAAKADLIVEGTVTAVQEDVSIDIALEGEPYLLDYHVATVTVTKVIKGNVSVGDQLQVKQFPSCTELLELTQSRRLFLCDYRAETPGMPCSIVMGAPGSMPGEGGPYVD